MGFQFHSLNTLRVCFFGVLRKPSRQERRPLGNLLRISCSELDQQVKRKHWMNQLVDESIWCIPSTTIIWSSRKIWWRILDESSWITVLFEDISFINIWWELEQSLIAGNWTSIFQIYLYQLIFPKGSKDYPMIRLQCAGCFWKNLMSVFGTAIPTARSLLLIEIRWVEI